MQPPLYFENGSPLAAFVHTLQLMVQHRKVLNNALQHNEHEYIILLQDITMLLEEKVVIGLRNQWARRVATPCVMAQRHLELDTKEDNVAKARKALEILGQCKDAELAVACMTWVREHFHVG